MQFDSNSLEITLILQSARSDDKIDPACVHENKLLEMAFA